MKRAVPAEGQESVWDYPRPPRVEPSSEHVVVRLGGVVVAESNASFRVLETSHPPVYYLPRGDFAKGVLSPAPGRSVCEFKGAASYLSVRGGGVVADAAGWTYPEPMPGFEVLRDTIALYPGRMDSCTVDEEVVEPQPGDFYGGWITSRVVGPFKGAPGTMFW
ncbi:MULTISPECIES: DUF427 domain-containing protein [unclassified Rathayibacter]|uniref:DUF427 domain-containing protein n=1 Tax=unclassified Rathayibacter TaxID=2609250 RepID=UPI0006F74B64|nr:MULTISPECIES: DUF427 domain-containing protein [unclassified Rathayibacter]KQQ01369.1 hypothetical protein ASF42_12870 [Rathayibacter sp. Leaf294]KQS11400.1 hypothetical protein ASG06_12870 [Rathayibacter sp. Leaf185]